MKPQRWIRLTIGIPASHQDLMIGQLAALGFGGFLQEERHLRAFIDSRSWTKDAKDRLAYFLDRFRHEFPKLSLDHSTSTVAKQNWNRKWEQSIKLLDATKRMVVKPSWQKLRKKDRGKIVLHIDPKMSFGTGHHETTRLCLVLLEEYVRPNVSVLDFGSGTGILAIASVKLGAGKAVAVDNDEWTIPNIKENLKRNRVEKKIRVLLGDSKVIPASPYDLIVANIDLPTIRTSHRRLIRRLKSGGIVIFSGILTSDLLAFYGLMAHKRLNPVNVIEENEWSAIAMMKV